MNSEKTYLKQKYNIVGFFGVEFIYLYGKEYKNKTIDFMDHVLSSLPQTNIISHCEGDTECSFIKLAKSYNHDIITISKVGEIFNNSKLSLYHNDNKEIVDFICDFSDILIIIKGHYKHRRIDYAGRNSISPIILYTYHNDKTKYIPYKS